ncbi:MAG: acyltransferase family protein [Planctomycetota bacterium]
MSNETGSIARRHDLDALRAIAMLLGIVLHGALSFVPLPDEAWAVHDVKQHSAYGVLMSVVHGFRMPLFFLISGFFTAMLWRKRGLLALMEHRFKRIFVPLMIGLFTIVPSVWVVSIGVNIDWRGGEGGSEVVEAPSGFWAAVIEGNVEALANSVEDDTDLDGRDPNFQCTPLAVAAWHGNVEVMAYLLDEGADISAPSGDGSTALHGAAFFGRVEAVELLMNRGADINQKNNNGETPIDSLRIDWETTQYFASTLSVHADKRAVEAGRSQIANMMQVDPLPEESQQDIEINGFWMLLTVFPFWHHLWFLVFLCWLVIAFPVYALFAKVSPVKAPKWLFNSWFCYLWLIPLTMVPQSSMGLLYPNYGPDTSAGLLPIPAVLFYYAIFFFFGAMYFDCDDQEGRLGSKWRWTLPIALIAIFPLGYELTLGELGINVDWLKQEYQRPLSVFLQVTYAWLMTFASMGLFRSLHSAENKTMRYLSDSSYFLYLAHLPLIILVQAFVRDWPVPGVIKLTLICTVTSLILLACYQLCVRYTLIGTMLNGPRQRPQPALERGLKEQEFTEITKA